MITRRQIICTTVAASVALPLCVEARTQTSSYGQTFAVCDICLGRHLLKDLRLVDHGEGNEDNLRYCNHCYEYTYLWLKNNPANTAIGHTPSAFSWDDYYEASRINGWQNV